MSLRSFSSNDDDEDERNMGAWSMEHGCSGRHPFRDSNDRESERMIELHMDGFGFSRDAHRSVTKDPNRHPHHGDRIVTALKNG